MYEPDHHGRPSLHPAQAIEPQATPFADAGTALDKIERLM